MKNPNKLQIFLRERGSRFIAILGMLGSDGAGERANAAALASKMLKEADLSWGEIAGAFGPAPASRGRSVQEEWLESQVRTLKSSLEKAQHRVLALEKRLHMMETEREFNPNTGPAGGGGGASESSHGTAGTGRFGTGGGRSRPRTYNAVLNDIIDQIENRLEPSDWEAKFLTSIRRRDHLTEKQLWRLQQLAEQAGVTHGDLND